MTNSQATLDAAYAGKTVVVTGAGGFIGYHLVQALLRCGANVVGVVRHPRRLAEMPPTPGLTLKTHDLTDPAGIEELFRGLDPHFVFHLASLPDAEESYAHSIQSIDTTLKPTISMLEAFRHSRNREVFIYGDSSKVYGNCGEPYTMQMPDQPNSSYAIAKAAAWRFCELYASSYGLSCVSIRPTMIYGPLQPRNVISYVIESVLARRDEITLLGGNQTRTPLYIDDAVEAYLLAGLQGESVSEKVINIGGPEEFTVCGLAEEIIQILGGNMPVVPRMTSKRVTEIERSTCHNQEALQWLNWRPRFSLRDGVNEIARVLTDELRKTA